MKRYLLATALVVAVVLSLFGAADAFGTGQNSQQALASAHAPSLASQVRRLTAQVRSLRKDTKLLAGAVVLLQGEVVIVHNDVVANYEGDICSLALTSDEFGEEWGQLNTRFGQPWFYFYTPASDQGACANVGVARPPFTGQLPTPAPFTELMGQLATLSKK